MSLVPFWLASLIANAAIVATEYYNRAAPGTLPLGKTWWLIIIAQVCLFRAFNGAPSWMAAWAVFFVGNAIMRIAVVHCTSNGEISSWYYTLAGVIVLGGGSYLVKSGMAGP